MSTKSRGQQLARVGVARQPQIGPPVPEPPALGACLHCLETLETHDRYAAGRLVDLYNELRHDTGWDHAETMEQLGVYMQALESAGGRYHELNALYYATFETSEGVCATMPPPETWPLIEVWSAQKELWETA